MTTRFVSTLSDHGCWIELRDGDAAVPVSSWAIHVNDADRRLGAKLLAQLDDGEAVIENDALYLEAPRVAAFTEQDLRDANLPPAVPFILELGAQGTLATPSFTFDIRWYRPDRRRLNAAAVRGIELSADGLRYTLQEPSYSLLRKVSEFNARAKTSLDERLLLWSELCELIGIEPQDDLRIKPDRYLQGLRVIPADRFTVEIDVDKQGELSIKPVLLSPLRTSGRQEEITESATASTLDPLLSPVQQELFASNFAALSPGRSKIPLGDGTYVIFSEPLANALTRIRELQDANRATKRQFLANPHGFLRNALVTEADSDKSAELAVPYFETEGFSDRVAGIGLWQRPTLPWVQAQTQGWLPPESVDVPVGHETFKVLTDDLPEVLADLESAVSDGIPRIDYGGSSIPATGEALNSFKASIQTLNDDADRYLEDSAEKEEAAKRRGPFALLAVDDLETGGYTASHSARPHAGFALPLISTTLKPHQEEGVRWLQRRWSEGYRGALLADDMGLGKSLTTLSFLVWLQSQMRQGLRPKLPCLVVVPTSLLHTWIAEHNEHLAGEGLGRPAIAYGSTLQYYKAEHRRKDVEGGQPSLRTELLRGEPWIITTYETLRDYQLSFGKIPLAVAVFDEAQRIKNPGASLKNAAKNMNADFFIAATGTPVENRLADLWSIVDLLEPDYLGSLRAFSKTYESAPDPSILQELRTKVEQPAAAVQTSRGAGLMLRRLKDGTLRGLPTKQEHFVERVMSPMQARAYDRALATARTMGRKHRDVLLALRGILNVSLHPNVNAAANAADYIGMSARYTSAFEILDRIHEKREKALLFLEMREAQAPLALLIQQRYGLLERPMIINGEVPAGQRQDRVARFQENRSSFDVMILSPRAGGVGLTLTSANHVIHLSRWWNPAVEDQCSDRVYRIGQTRPVHIYYLMAVHPEHGVHSFDIKLNALLMRKRALSRDLLAPMIFGEDDAQELFADTVENATNV